MEKKFVVALLLTTYCCLSCGAGLRRTPKVYNALITTDENLSSSRAYPVIQPTIIDPYNPYNPYSHPFVRLGQPITPGFYPRQQQQFPYSFNHFPQHNMPEPPAEQPPSDTNSSQEENNEPDAPKSDKKKPTATPPKEKLPIPLNEYGFPPSLIPLRNSINMSPSYNYPRYPQYPQYHQIYDPLTGYPTYNPYAGYYPNPNYPPPPLPADHGKRPNPFFPSSPTPTTDGTTPLTTTAETKQPESSSAAPNFDDIKNGSKSKNSDVPDVPPPAVPSGANNSS